MISLLPCPFCGGEPKHNDGGNSTYGRFWWSVWCDECEIQMSDREVWSHEADRSVLALPAKECFERWNRRPTEGAAA